MSSDKKPNRPSPPTHLPLPLRPMRRGTLTERFVKCSKPGCACGRRKESRHGPYYSLTRKVKGKTSSRYLSKEQAAVARRQIEEGHAFRQQIAAYWEACEKLADEELDTIAEGSPQATEKGGSGEQSSP